MWSSEFLAACSRATTSGPVQTFAAVSIDTRTLQPGSLYVALRGENYDGHKFVAQAINAGATGVLVSQAMTVPEHVCVLRVADTLLALQMMGQAARETLSGPLVAVTGSNGKTTTRQLIASVLRAHWGDSACLSTQGNFNNHIGVPLTLLRLGAEHRTAVVELGMNHFHELSLLSSLARPDIAVITNAGPAHLEGVGSIAGVAKAKAEIFDGMTASGVAILNADDHFFPYWQVINRDRKIVSFGLGERADVRGNFDAVGNVLTVIRGLSEPLSVRLPFAGRHNAANALAAVAVATTQGIPAMTIKRGLETATNIGGRLARREISKQLRVIDDSYNANPASVRAAVQVLLSEPGQKIFVLGDMAELGDDSDALHAELIRDIEHSAVDELITLGPRTHRAAHLVGGRTTAYQDLPSLVQHLRERATQPTTLLVKGAHSMAMHRVIDALAAPLEREK